MLPLPLPLAFDAAAAADAAARCVQSFNLNYVDINLQFTFIKYKLSGRLLKTVHTMRVHFFKAANWLYEIWSSTFVTIYIESHTSHLLRETIAFAIVPCEQVFRILYCTKGLQLRLQKLS